MEYHPLKGLTLLTFYIQPKAYIADVKVDNRKFRKLKKKAPNYRHGGMHIKISFGPQEVRKGRLITP